MRRCLVDTSVFVYALGGEHPLRKPCKQVVRSLGGGEVAGEVSADLLHELAHQRHRRTGDRAGAAAAAREAAQICPIHDVTGEDALRALGLFERHARLDARDAVFAAVAIGRGIDAILSSDRAFDGIDGLDRVDPADVQAVRALAGA